MTQAGRRKFGYGREHKAFRTSQLLAACTGGRRVLTGRVLGGRQGERRAEGGCGAMGARAAIKAENAGR